MKGINKETERNQGITDRHFRTDITRQICLKKYFKKTNNDKN